MYDTVYIPTGLHTQSTVSMHQNHTQSKTRMLDNKKNLAQFFGKS